MKTPTQTFNVSFPRALVAEIDAVTEQEFASRSDFLRTAALQYIRNKKQWEYLFNEGQKIGAQTKPLSEEEVASSITEQRRARRTWHIRQQA